MSTYPEGHPLEGAYVWRGYPWPTRHDGHGDKPSVSAYPNQGLDLATDPYGYSSSGHKARAAADIARALGVPVPPLGTAGHCKYRGLFTPLGTPVAQLSRTGGDMLMSQCGYCARQLAKCVCGRGLDDEGD